MSTISTYVGDGSTKQFDITFSYSDSETIKAKIGGVEAAFTFVNPSRVEFATAPAAGIGVRLYRETDVATPVVDFEDGAIIRAPDLDAAVAQVRRRAEELGSETVDITSRSLKVPIGEVGIDLPIASERTNKFLSFLANGTPFMSEGTGADIGLRGDLAGALGAYIVGYTGVGTSPRTRPTSEKFQEAQSLLDKAGSVADGTTSNNAAFAAAVTDGGVWRIPKQNDPYVLDERITVGDVIFIVDDGVEIIWTGGVASAYDYVILAQSNTAFYANGGWTIRAADRDQLRYSIIAAGADNVTVEGLTAHNLQRLWSKADTGGDPEDENAYGDVVTSGPGANISTNIHVSGGGCIFDVPATGTLTGGADHFSYTFNWSVSNSRYSGTSGAIQWWGGNANPANDGAVGNERKCRHGLISNCYTDTAVSGIWGSMGQDLEINDSTAINNEDVGLDCEGGIDVRFNTCVGRDGARGAGAAFFFNRGLEFNTCLFASSNSENDVFQISNPSQSVDNHSISSSDCTFVCTDTTPSRINPAAVRYLKMVNPTFNNVLCTVAASNNHSTDIINPTVILPNAGGTPSSVFTVNTGTDILTHDASLRLQPFARVRLSTTGTLPAPGATGTDYFATPITATTCKLSTSVGNAAKVSPVYVDFSDTGTGVHTITTALSAIEVGGNNQTGGIAGHCMISEPKIYSEATQPAGSVGIYVAQYDSNSAPITIVKDGHIANMPIDIQFNWGGSNAGFSGKFLVFDNVTNNNIVFFQNDAAAAGSFNYWDNRNPAGVLFNRAAHISDATVAAGANPTKAEFDSVVAKLNAVFDILEGTNAGLMAP